VIDGLNIVRTITHSHSYSWFQSKSWTKLCSCTTRYLRMQAFGAL